MTSSNRDIRDIVIVGGGTAGWMAAAGMARFLGTSRYSITLVESEQIGTVGVGEATIPKIVLFNQGLGIDEDTFIRETNATFKLGIDFVGWQRPDKVYFHPFGKLGLDIEGVDFQHYWMRWREATQSDDHGLFNIETLAARALKFDRDPAGHAGFPRVNYAYQFDASLYAAFLRRYCEKLGVRRVEGKVAEVHQDGESGHVTRLGLEDGRDIGGDLFIDCTGFRGLLIEQTLKAGYEDWSHWLPVDRAVAVPCERQGPLTPYTRATARPAGWQWRIPLQHRTGNGHVYSSAFMSDDEAADILMASLDGAPLADPRQLRFTTGYRKLNWSKNVIAMGLASGFLEPLESTSIHLIQAAIGRLLDIFPRKVEAPILRDAFNTSMRRHYTRIRDFLVTHYHQTDREDTPFWSHVKNYEPPEEVARRMELFTERGEVLAADDELFGEPSWFFVLNGQGRQPKAYHPVANFLPEDELRNRLAYLRQGINARLQRMPSHEAYIARYCASPTKPLRAESSNS